MQILVMVVFCQFLLLSKTSQVLPKGCDKDKHNIFWVMQYLATDVYADGKLVQKFKVKKGKPLSGYCIPLGTRLLAATNTIKVKNRIPVYLIGSMEGQDLVTNNEWKCTHTVQSGSNWYELDFNDTSWPQAHSVPVNLTSTTTHIPISSRAEKLHSGSLPNATTFFCRSPLAQVERKTYTRSGFATIASRNMRMTSHVIDTSHVFSIVECVLRCLTFKDCASLNFQQRGKNPNRRKCESINTRNYENHNFMKNDHYDHYIVIEKKDRPFP